MTSISPEAWATLLDKDGNVVRRIKMNPMRPFPRIIRIGIRFYINNNDSSGTYTEADVYRPAEEGEYHG